MTSPPKRVRFATTTDIAPSPPSPTHSSSSSDNDPNDAFEMKFDFTKFFLMFDLESDVAKYLVDLDLDRFVTNLELVIINSRRLRSRRAVGALPLPERLSLQQIVLKARAVLMQDIESLEAVFKRMERRGLAGAMGLRDNIHMAREFIDRVTATRSDTDTEDERRASYEARRRSATILQPDAAGQQVCQVNPAERPPSDLTRRSRPTVHIQHSPPAPFPTIRHSQHYYVPISQSAPTTLHQALSQPEPRTRRVTMPSSHSKEYCQHHSNHLGRHRQSDPTVPLHQPASSTSSPLALSSTKAKRSSFPTSPRPNPHEWYQARTYPDAKTAPRTPYV